MPNKASDLWPPQPLKKAEAHRIKKIAFGSLRERVRPLVTFDAEATAILNSSTAKELIMFLGLEWEENDISAQILDEVLQERFELPYERQEIDQQISKILFRFRVQFVHVFHRNKSNIIEVEKRGSVSVDHIIVEQWLRSLEKGLREKIMGHFAYKHICTDSELHALYIQEGGVPGLAINDEYEVEPPLDEDDEEEQEEWRASGESRFTATNNPTALLDYDDYDETTDGEVSIESMYEYAVLKQFYEKILQD